MIRTISLPVYNRPKYLEQLLSDLARNPAAKGWQVFFNIEPGCEESEKLCEEFTFLETSIEYNKDRLGCAGNVYRAISRAFQSGSEFNIHFADDLRVGSDGFDLLKWYIENTNLKQERFISCSLFNGNSEADKPNDLFLNRFGYVGTGWGLWKSVWLKYVKDNWWDTSIPRRVLARFSEYEAYPGWDYVVHSIAIENKLMSIQPRYSRTTHIGREGGMHQTPEQWDENFANHEWNENGAEKRFALREYML